LTGGPRLSAPARTRALPPLPLTAQWGRLVGANLLRRAPSLAILRAPLVSPATRSLTALSILWAPPIETFPPEPPAHDQRVAVDSALTTHAEVALVPNLTLF
jgi:hypothetical protein